MPAETCIMGLFRDERRAAQVGGAPLLHEHRVVAHARHVPKFVITGQHGFRPEALGHAEGSAFQTMFMPMIRIIRKRTISISPRVHAMTRKLENAMIES